jgi:UDP-N-acetylmuramoylalanine--D-glutamate ligase
MNIEWLDNKTVFVFGLGKSGKMTIEFLLKTKVAKIYAWNDTKEPISKLEKLYKKEERLKFISQSRVNWKKIDFLVISPGIPLTHPKPHKVVKLAIKVKCPIIGDVEILYRSNKEAKFIGITGTNGKSTTTALIGHIFKKAKISSDVGGNLGTPALQLKNREAYILEMSSYQLDLIDEISFDIAILLNITPDHIDRHGDMRGYKKAKKRIFKNQTEDDYAIISTDYKNTNGIYEMVKKKGGNAIPISAINVVKGGVSVFDGKIYNNIGEKEAIWNMGDPKDLRGKHNAENVAAAFVASYLYGIDEKEIVSAIKSFKGLRHRMQFVRKVGKISFINDSKATNDISTEQALNTYDNIYWILGGKSKKGGIESLKPFFSKIKHAFLIGDATEEFAETLEGKVEYTKCGTLRKATNKAYKLAKEAGKKENLNIILSPACASFDQWNNFEERGETFIKIVEDL